MKKEVLNLNLAALLLASFLLTSFAMPTYASTNRITIDGNIEDWEGIAPLATDPVGDTEAWSKDSSLLSLSNISTAEDPNKVALNDMARDLVALYTYFRDPDWIYFRLDVGGLYPGAFDRSPKTCTICQGATITYPNVTAYIFLFDVLRNAGCKVAPPCMEIDMNWEYTEPVVDARWDFYIQFDGSFYAAYSTGTYSSESWTELNEEGTGHMFAINYTYGVIELAIRRAIIEAKYPQLNKVNLFVYSYKPGEIHDKVGHFVHAFDPKHPGCPGGAAWDGYCVNYPDVPPGSKAGEDNMLHPDAGPDYADYFNVMGNLAPPSQWTARAQYRGPLFTVDMTYIPVVHDVAVTSISISPIKVTKGESVTVRVTVRNQGEEAETFTVTVYYDGTQISSQSITNLEPGSSQTLTFTWDTKDVKGGTYSIKASATLEGDTNPANNEATAEQQVTVSEPELPIETIIAIVVVVIVVIAVAVLLVRRRRGAVVSK